jgi:hypothetical protein
VARNALLGIALVSLLAAGCSGGEAAEAKQAAAAQAQLAKLRVRTDSLKQVHEARMAAAADSTASADSTTASAGSAAAPADTASSRASLAATTAVAAPARDSLQTGKAAPSAGATQAEAEAALADSVQKAREIEVYRETFAYAGGTRDPFASLINKDKVGPEIADLDLVGVYMDLRTPSNNVVVLREKGTSAKRHKMRVGDQLGRARLVQIRPRDAVFTIQDFGFERQETLSLRKQEVETP